MIDTGFFGELALNATAISNLDLEFVKDAKYTLANGSTISARTYRGWIRWLGEGREVDVVEMAGNPVIGTALLMDHRLTVDFVPGGVVEIEAIPSV